jgi:hypothetical protein
MRASGNRWFSRAKSPRTTNPAPAVHSTGPGGQAFTAPAPTVSWSPTSPISAHSPDGRTAIALVPAHPWLIVSPISETCG